MSKITGDDVASTCFAAGIGAGGLVSSGGGGPASLPGVAASRVVASAEPSRARASPCCPSVRPPSTPAPEEAALQAVPAALAPRRPARRAAWARCICRTLCESAASMSSGLRGARARRNLPGQAPVRGAYSRRNEVPARALPAPCRVDAPRARGVQRFVAAGDAVRRRRRRDCPEVARRGPRRDEGRASRDGRAPGTRRGRRQRRVRRHRVRRPRPRCGTCARAGPRRAGLEPRRRRAAPLRRRRDADQRGAVRVDVRGAQPRRLRQELAPAEPVHPRPRDGEHRPGPRPLRLQHRGRVVRVLEVLHEHGRRGDDRGGVARQRAGGRARAGGDAVRAAAVPDGGRPDLCRHGRLGLRDPPRPHRQLAELPRLARALACVRAVLRFRPDHGPVGGCDDGLRVHRRIPVAHDSATPPPSTSATTTAPT